MSLLANIQGFAKSAMEALAPATCEICGRPLVDGEETLCLGCYVELPRTQMHVDDFNVIHQRIAMPGYPVKRAGAYFHYLHDTDCAYLLQKAKYSMRPYLAERLGEMYAEEVRGDGFFAGVDVLLPVPLHWTKLVRRGYNQAEMICRGVSRVTGIPIADNLRVRRHGAQARKGAAGRRDNAQDIFYVEHAGELRGLHVMIVDDIITTGSTIFGAVKAVHDACGPREVSVMGLGCTKLR